MLVPRKLGNILHLRKLSFLLEEKKEMGSGKKEKVETWEGRFKLLDIKCRRKESKEAGGELERDRSLKLALKRGNSFLAGVTFYIEIQLVLEDRARPLPYPKPHQIDSTSSINDLHHNI
jgi:hypothetical protein